MRCSDIACCTPTVQLSVPKSFHTSAALFTLFLLICVCWRTYENIFFGGHYIFLFMESTCFGNMEIWHCNIRVKWSKRETIVTRTITGIFHTDTRIISLNFQVYIGLLKLSKMYGLCLFLNFVPCIFYKLEIADLCKVLAVE